MPEVLEVELTRRGLAHLAGLQIAAVEATDPLVVQEGVDVLAVGSRITGFERRGKQLTMSTDGPTIGIHLGMTGRVLLDHISAIGGLAYGGRSDVVRWDRWVVVLGSGQRFRLHDPRRLGRVVLDPDLDRLGPDVLTLRRSDLVRALEGRRAPLKAVLLDQRAVAGLGNLLVDEVLWWSGLDPRRAASELSPAELEILHRQIRRRLPIMLRRGGSHTGTLSPTLRAAASAVCPREGVRLARAAVGGRTTVWCPDHQH